MGARLPQIIPNNGTMMTYNPVTNPALPAVLYTKPKLLKSGSEKQE